MKSHDMFGDLGVSFRPVTKDKTENPLGCGDFQNLSSIRLDGSISKFSQWETTVLHYENE